MVYLPRYLLVEDDKQHDQDAEGVEEAVSTERPPIEVRCGPREQGTHRDDEHDVEHGAADHTRHTDVVLGEEHADDDGSELRGGGPSSHEGRTSHVGGHLEFCSERGQKLEVKYIFLSDKIRFESFSIIKVYGNLILFKFIT